jgi:hypothetical protein
MSKWDDEGMTDKVIEVLGDVRLANDSGHHFGRPFMASYQIAIEIERGHPGTASALGKKLGGAGIGEQVSVAQYVANELSKQIKAMGDRHAIEGGFLSTVDVASMTYSSPDGDITSSLTGTGFDLGLFRLRS